MEKIAVKSEELLEAIAYDREYRWRCPQCGRHLSELDIVDPVYSARIRRIEGGKSPCCNKDIKLRIRG